MKVSYQAITRVYNWIYSGKDKCIKEVFSKIEKNKKSITGRSGSLLKRYPQYRFLRELFG